MTMKITTNKKDGTFIIETVREFLLIDRNVKGAYLHSGTPNLDIFYRDCDHAMSLHFENVTEAEEAFRLVKEYVKKQG